MDVISEIRRLPTLSKAELIELWQQYFHNAPVCIRKEYYVRQIAHRLQELAYGGLDSSMKEKIERVANLNKNAMKGLPLPGTRLIKEYKGVEYTVTVHNDGFEYLGIKYPALSTVAKRITGQRISGKRFFGLE